MHRGPRSLESGPIRRQRAPRGDGAFTPSSLELDDVLQAIVAAAADLTGAALVAIWTANDDARVLERRAVSDPELARDYPTERQPYGVGLAGLVAQHRRPVRVPDVAADPRAIAGAWFVSHG